MLTAPVASVRDIREYCRMMARELGTMWDSRGTPVGLPWDTGDIPSPGTGHLPEHQEGPRLGGLRGWD